MRYLDEIINTYHTFYTYCMDNEISINWWYFVKILFLRYRYGISVNDFFNNELYDHSKSHKEYYLKNSNTQKKWKYAHAVFLPNAKKWWLFKHKFDYLISKLYCPGLNARDYFMYQFYNLSIEAKKTFITDGMLKKMNYSFNGGKSVAKINAHQILDDKMKFNEYFSDYLGREWIYSRKASHDDYLNICKNGFVIVKPLDGDSGKGVEKWAVETLDEIEELYRKTHEKDFLIEEVLCNHKTIRNIHPSSLNTIRINSVYHNGVVDITGAVIRIGVGNHATDNFGTGGLAAEINCDTGIVYTRAVPWGQGEYYIHPDTNTKIIGLEIPYWESVKDMVIRAHKKLPDMQYIGWDVAVCDDEKIALIEANTHSGVELQQYPSLKGKKSVYNSIKKCF